MHIAALGDVVLDVIVDVPGGLNLDDDAEATITLSAGGQAANVAAWAAHLGAEATLIGPQGSSDAAGLIARRLEERRIRFQGIPVGRDGTVVSLVTAGQRTLASDAGDQTWLSRVTVGDLPEHLDWLHLSCYPLLRSIEPLVLVPVVERARAGGSRVSIDLSSAALLRAFEPRRFRARLTALAPDLVFANAEEWAALDWPDDRLPFELILKRGETGAEMTVAGTTTTHRAHAVQAIDATGAGDALAAGYLVGGADLAMRTAAECVRTTGAQPGTDQR